MVSGVVTIKNKKGYFKIISFILIGILIIKVSVCSVLTFGIEPPVDISNQATWEDDDTLKILAIGNSFTMDAMEYVYEISKAAGIDNIRLGYLYIGGCQLSRHLSNAKNDSSEYRYYTNDSGTWDMVDSYKMSDAVKSDNWDFISFQQASLVSGFADTYDDLNELMAIVEPLCTNEDVEFVWHMTWAYQSDYIERELDTYNKDQITMYNAIISAVQEKIVPNQKITKIIPNSTAIQNARTSYLGDTLTRDGRHLSYSQGRIIAATTLVDSLVGIDWDNFDLSSLSSDQIFLKVALESVKNAVKTPFAVTQSEIKELTDGIDLTKYEEKDYALYKNKYYQSTTTTELMDKEGTRDRFFATEKFTKDTLPIGSVILIYPGWQYRPEGWVNNLLSNSSTRPRPDVVTVQMVNVTEGWWGNLTTRAFNISKKDNSSLTDYTESQIHDIFKIFIPIPNTTDHTPGDINGDSEVNNKDLTRLFQYLSEWDVEVSEAALDVNGDGEVNNKDLTRLFQYLSEWDVEIH